MWVQHPRGVVLLRDDWDVGLGRGQPSSGAGAGPGLPVLGAVGAPNVSFQGLVLSSWDLFPSTSVQKCLNLKAARFNFPYASEMPWANSFTRFWGRELRLSRKAFLCQGHLLHCLQEKLPKAGDRVNLQCCTSQSLAAVGNITPPSPYPGTIEEQLWIWKQRGKDGSDWGKKSIEAGAASRGLQSPVSPMVKEKVDMTRGLPVVPLSFLRKGR